jgi:hypothetical protein
MLKPLTMATLSLPKLVTLPLRRKQRRSIAAKDRILVEAKAAVVPVITVARQRTLAKARAAARLTVAKNTRVTQRA